MTSQEAKTRLFEGNSRYAADKLRSEGNNSSARNELVAGQKPYAIILSCADSRVVPEFLFDTGLGELFVVRVAGNVANTESIASIEYAVAHLNTKLIVVLGHQSCGAVNAAIQGGDNGYNLNQLLSHVAPALAKSGEGADANDVVRINARINAEELVNRSQIVANAVENDGVEIVPAYYHLDSGKVELL